MRSQAKVVSLLNINKQTHITVLNETEDELYIPGKSFRILDKLIGRLCTCVYVYVCISINIYIYHAFLQAHPVVHHIESQRWCPFVRASASSSSVNWDLRVSSSHQGSATRQPASVSQMVTQGSESFNKHDFAKEQLRGEEKEIKSCILAQKKH